MNRVFLFVYLVFMSFLCVFSQERLFHDEQIDSMLEQAEKYIPEFHREDIVDYFPIYSLWEKEEYSKREYYYIPKYEEIEPFLDFDNLELYEIIVRTKTKRWSLEGKYYDADDFCGRVTYDKHYLRLWAYIDNVKPDKLYYLFGQFSSLLIEKDNTRYLVVDDGNSFRECDWPYLCGGNLHHYDRWTFPKRFPKVLWGGGPW